MHVCRLGGLCPAARRAYSTRDRSPCQLLGRFCLVLGADPRLSGGAELGIVAISRAQRAAVSAAFFVVELDAEHASVSPEPEIRHSSTLSTSAAEIRSSFPPSRNAVNSPRATICRIKDSEHSQRSASDLALYGLGRGAVTYSLGRSALRSCPPVAVTSAYAFQQFRDPSF